MDTKYDKSAKQCVNCPGRTDHETADCPLTVLREWLSGDRPGWDIRPAIRALLSEQPQASAAQSAPAGEREAFLNAATQHIRENQKDWVLLDGHDDEQEWAWLGFRLGAAWQRTQSAPVVPVKLEIGAYYTSTRGFGRMQYLGETHDIDGWLPTFRNQEGKRKFYRIEELPNAFLEFAPAQPAAQEVIDKPARIGATVFRPGVSVRTVIERAYRQYEYVESNLGGIPPEALDKDQGEVQRLREALASAGKAISCLMQERDALIAQKGDNA